MLEVAPPSTLSQALTQAQSNRNRELGERRGE